MLKPWLRDVILLLGFGLLFTGLWWERPSVAMVVVGGILLALCARSIKA